MANTVLTQIITKPITVTGPSKIWDICSIPCAGLGPAENGWEPEGRPRRVGGRRAGEGRGRGPGVVEAAVTGGGGLNRRRRIHLPHKIIFSMFQGDCRLVVTRFNPEVLLIFSQCFSVIVKLGERNKCHLNQLSLYIFHNFTEQPFLAISYISYPVFHP